MSTNIITVGCSFTSPPGRWGLQDYVNSGSNLTDYNLSHPSVGNTFICQNTIEFLETANLNPEKTIVLVMWTGLLRLDFPLSKDWYDYFVDSDSSLATSLDSYGYSKSFPNLYYLSSGGPGAGTDCKFLRKTYWDNNTYTKQIWNNIYKINDEISLCKNNLLMIIALENYLLANKYQFKFTSYFDYWLNEEYHPISGDPGLGYCLKNETLYKSYKKTNWMDIESLGDYCVRNNELDSTVHPTPKGHSDWGENILIPYLVNNFHM